MSMRLDFLDFLEEVVLEEVVDLVDLVLFGFPVRGGMSLLVGSMIE